MITLSAPSFWVNVSHCTLVYKVPSSCETSRGIYIVVVVVVVHSTDPDGGFFSDLPLSFYHSLSVLISTSSVPPTTSQTRIPPARPPPHQTHHALSHSDILELKPRKRIRSGSYNALSTQRGQKAPETMGNPVHAEKPMWVMCACG